MGNPPLRASRKQQGPKRVHDMRVTDGIFFVLRTGTPWRDLPERYGPCTTCFNRYNRWSRNGLWEKIMSKLQELAEGDDNDGGGGELRLRMADSSSVRVRRHGAGAPRDGEPPEVGLCCPDHLRLTGLIRQSGELRAISRVPVMGAVLDIQGSQHPVFSPRLPDFRR